MDKQREIVLHYLQAHLAVFYLQAQFVDINAKMMEEKEQYTLCTRINEWWIFQILESNLLFIF
jgi:hypothetical protein